MGYRAARSHDRLDRLFSPAWGQDHLALLEAGRGPGRVVAPGRHGNRRAPAPLAVAEDDGENEDHKQNARNRETDDPEQPARPCLVLALILLRVRADSLDGITTEHDR